MGAGGAVAAGTGGAGTGGATSVGTGGAGIGGTGTGGAGTAGAGVVSGCPDLDQDGIPDCQETLVANPSFNSTTAGWTAETGSSLSWASTDGAGSSQSGAIAVTNTDTDASHAVNGWITVGASQCLSVVAGSSYEVDVQAFQPSGQGSGWAGSAGFVIDYHQSSGCAGSPAGASYLSQQVTATGAWTTIRGQTTQIPLGVASVAVRLVAIKPAAQPSWEALFDNVLVRVR